VIHAFGLEPGLLVRWVLGGELRFIREAFGLGTSRAMLEIRKFHKWKRQVLELAADLTERERKQVDELVELFEESRFFRHDAAAYDGTITWLENAEREHLRRDYRGILATDNPRRNPAVLVAERIEPTDERLCCPSRLTAARTAEAIAHALGPMLSNCHVLHLVDPHFGPENARHRQVLLALCDRLNDEVTVHVHCGVASDAPVTPSRGFFEQSAETMASRLPSNVVVRFVRWTQRPGGDRLHNRYVMTPLGGVMLGIGLDAGKEGETDDLLLLSREQYRRRWTQYAMNDGTFQVVDRPAEVRGKRRR
jgi:hypothetical protein